MIADKDYGLTRDKKVCDFLAPEAATLLARQGQEIPDADAKKYGLMPEDAPPSAPPTTAKSIGTLAPATDAEAGATASAEGADNETTWQTPSSPTPPETRSNSTSRARASSKTLPAEPQP